LLSDAVFESFKNLFNNIIQILRPISIRNNLTKELQSIQMIKIHEKPNNIKELTKRIQKIYNIRGSVDLKNNTECIPPERINPKLQFVMPTNSKLGKNKIFDEFENLDNKLECVNQKIENEIRRQANSLDKISKPLMKNYSDYKETGTKKPLKLNNYNSFSCVSDQAVQKEDEVASEKFEINNTFQIENIDYEQFKSNLDKEMEEVIPSQQGTNLNFEQISEIKE